MSTAPFTLLYIHGFNSSPLSHKAQQLQQWLASTRPHVVLALPSLKPFPLDAIAQLEAIIKAAPGKVGLVGSSLGGFYAAYLAEKYALPAVLVNPAVRPFDTLSCHLGENENFHTQEKYVLTQQHVDDLRSLFVEKPSRPQDLWLMVQTADETLDYREATAHYCKSPALIEYGGDHSFQNFDRYFTPVLAFLCNTASLNTA